MDCGFQASVIVLCGRFGVLVALCFGSGASSLANPQWNSLSNSSLHKIHVSIAQLEYNQKSQSVEITLRVYTDDLENAVSQHSKRPVKIDPATANKDKRVGEAILAYVRNSLELKSKSGSLVKLNWVRMEWQVDMYWLYLEGRLPGASGNSNGLDGAQLRNKIFCDLFDDQVNIVNTKIHEKQVGLMFEAKDGFKIITDRVISTSK